MFACIHKNENGSVHVGLKYSISECCVCVQRNDNGSKGVQTVTIMYTCLQKWVLLGGTKACNNNEMLFC